MTRTMKTISMTMIIMIAMIALLPVGTASAAPANPNSSTFGNQAATQDGLLKKNPCRGYNQTAWNPAYYPGYGPCTGYYYTRYPTFFINSVVRNGSVTVTAYDLPANDRFNVMMNYMGTAGICGIVVASFQTGGGGTQTMTFNIPPTFYGQFQIAMRMQSSTGSGFYAYNWFYNNSTY